MKSHQGQGGHGATAPTLGIGRRTSGEAGSTLTHETMAETGGSGGSGMTGDDAGTLLPPGQSAQSGAEKVRRGKEEMADSGARGYQDTRGEQAGGTGTGLGTPETGANQNADDLEAGVRRRQ